MNQIDNDKKPKLAFPAFEMVCVELPKDESGTPKEKGRFQVISFDGNGGENRYGLFVINMDDQSVDTYSKTLGSLLDICPDNTFPKPTYQGAAHSEDIEDLIQKHNWLIVKGEVSQEEPMTLGELFQKGVYEGKLEGFGFERGTDGIILNQDTIEENLLTERINETQGDAESWMLFVAGTGMTLFGMAVLLSGGSYFVGWWSYFPSSIQ